MKYARLDRIRLTEAIHAALEMLPSRTRQAFELTRYQSVPKPEVAKRLAVDPYELSVLIHDAERTLFEQLRQLWQRPGGEPPAISVKPPLKTLISPCPKTQTCC